MDLIEQADALEAANAVAEASELLLTTVTAQQLVDTVPEEPDWLVPGLLAKGWALMVSAREKTGKGTLIAYLLGRLESGEDSVFGFGCPERHTALVFTEEPDDSIAETARDAGLRRAEYVFGWDLPVEIRGLPAKDGTRWLATVEALIRTAVAADHSILFIDNVSRASGVDDEAGTEMTRRVEMAADRAKAAGLTLIVDHHHRKSGGDMRDRARGGTGSVGAVDVSLSMDRGKDENDRRRPLSCVGRRKATIWSRVIELNEDGTEYAEVERAEGDADNGHRASGAGSLEATRMKLMRELCLQAKEDTGSEWLTPDEVAEAWGILGRSAKAYLQDRVPAGTVLEGEKRERSRTYAAPGWEQADTIIDAPSF